MNTQGKLPLTQVFEVDDAFLDAVCKKMNAEFYETLVERLKATLAQEMKQMLTTTQYFSLQEVADLTNQSYRTVCRHMRNYMEDAAGTQLPVEKKNDKEYVVTREALKDYAGTRLPAGFFANQTVEHND